MPSLLCLDLGTSAAKAALIDLDGISQAQASSSYPTRTTPDGGAEQDPAHWVRAARAVIMQVLQDGPDDLEPAALCMTGQMQDLVLETDRAVDGRAVPAVLYSDTRATQEAEELHALLHNEATPGQWEELTGNLQDATSCAAMFRRLARTDPEAVRSARGMVFGPAGHLAHLLGCGLWCDPTTAAATGLLDAETRTWSAPIAAAAGIDEHLLPALTTHVGQSIGRTDVSAEELLGLPPGIPVVLAPGDAGATTLGIVGLHPGDDYAYLGTSGWLASVLPTPQRANPATRPGPAPPGTSGLETRTAPVRPESAPVQRGVSHHLALGATGGADGQILRISALLAAGAAASWARDALLDGATPAEADSLLTRREEQHGRGPTGLLALPSILGERYPVRDAGLRAAIIGMGPHTRGIDMYAAVLEGVAHALSHAGRQATSDGEASAARTLAVTGGGSLSLPWLHILADVTGRPVRTVQETDAALIGCAIAGAEALDLEHRIRPLAARENGRTVHPEPEAVRGHVALRPAHRAVYDAVRVINALR